ncbi:DUF7544 domain-containing protein [Halobellus rarus]|uniref:Glycerophosphoryl diester phosphodiesterase membrane domain-containing protein n=1 Tax=Halobellus rarus TaxID=1126237 RepID=A0ABD6CR00_9EURY|nr:hypothetical protein [Halobellus rarus]
MTLYAVEAIDDAIDATREFLWPFDLGRWARLALVLFFVGGAGGTPPFQFGGGGPSGTGSQTPNVSGIPETVPPPGGAELAVIAAIFGTILALGLAFVFVGSVMEFVFVESLRRERVTVRRYWSERWRQGARLFGFRVVLGALTLGVIGGTLAAILWPVFVGEAAVSVGLLFLAIPVFVVVSVISGLVGGFTTMFVVPVMIAEDRALLSAWRRFWSTLTGQWKQYAVYAVLSFVLQLVAGILSSIVTVLAAVAVAIPFGMVGLLGVGLLSVSEIAGWALIGLAVALFVIAVIVVGLFVAVPVQTYLRYYALLVLGDTEAAFDLIPERRAAIRE